MKKRNFWPSFTWSGKKKQALQPEELADTVLFLASGDSRAQDKTSSPTWAGGIIKQGHTGLIQLEDDK